MTDIKLTIKRGKEDKAISHDLLTQMENKLIVSNTLREWDSKHRTEGVEGQTCIGLFHVQENNGVVTFKYRD